MIACLALNCYAQVVSSMRLYRRQSRNITTTGIKLFRIANDAKLLQTSMSSIKHHNDSDANLLKS